MAKKNEATKELAYMLFMSGVSQKDIQERCGIGSPVTLNRWINDGGWREKRAAKTITRTELVNGIIKKILDMLDGEEINADALVKLASTIKNLDNQSNVVMVMDVFISFSGWLNQQAAIDKDLTIDIIKLFNKYQDAYVSQKLAGNDS